MALVSRRRPRLLEVECALVRRRLEADAEDAALLGGGGQRAAPTDDGRACQHRRPGGHGPHRVGRRSGVARLGAVRRDALPYDLRRGRAGIIGVGGGRDVLTAIRFGNAPITGIEINKLLLGVIQGPFKRFSPLADHPGVRLVHDEARSYLTENR